MSEDSARFYCYCMQERIEKRYPTVDEAAKVTEADMASEAWQQDVKACLGGTWNTENRAEFMSVCVSNAKSGIGEEKAKIYCECMMFKIEKAYPSYAEADKLTVEKLSTPAWKKIVQGCMDF